MSVPEITAVSTTVNYLKPPPDGSKPWVEISTKTGKHSSNFSLEAKQVIIENVRGHESEYDLDTTGFLFRGHESQMQYSDFEDEVTIKDVYYKESAELIKKVTGANQVVVYNHAKRTLFEVVRKNRLGVLDSPNEQLPQDIVQNVHSDHTPNEATKFLHILPEVPKELVPPLLKHRFQIINLWRPINHPAIDTPLALCDYRSINWGKDLVAASLIHPDYITEIIRTAILVLHTAFVDPTTPEDAPPRESIELRALVFYDDLPNEA
ncbi:hypothetical protein Clacol_005910 [Clathrus columnatus]|uniref:Vitellogenin n=1 Tax=Clathrus columnatus TaxID=1419009 RepID=A0AAV5AER4_9AGAM|nr:hypothetical protein Clacol_005910 [Clathrus columnatus]